MTGTGAGGSGAPERRGGESETWARRLLQVTVLDLASTLLVSLGVTLLHDGFWFNAAVTLAAVTGVLVGALYVYRHSAHAVPDRVRAGLWRGVAGAMWTLAGAAAMALVLLAVVGIRQVGAGSASCGQALELRVLTSPEALTALRSAATDFVNVSRDHGCRKYGVTVVSDPGPLPLYDGFRRLWRRSEAPDGQRIDDVRLFGPQPDVWIPSSTAEYDFVPRGPDPARAGREDALGPRGAADGSAHDPAFRLLGSLGSSPLVLALFSAAGKRAENPTRAPLYSQTAELLRDFADAGVRLRGIARPVPETSAAGLAVTPVLYGATAGRDTEDERFASRADLVAPDAVSLFCRYRLQAARGEAPPGDVAVAVPEQALYDYDLGRPLGDRCGAVGPDGLRPGFRLHPFYAADLPALDYPFVQVRWRGQDTRERDAAVRAFRRRLARSPLTSQGFRDDRGVEAADGGAGAAGPLRLPGMSAHTVAEVVPLNRPEEFQRTLDRIRVARPRVSVSLVLDVSGSMGDAARGRGGARLSRGALFLQNLVAQLQWGDDVALRTWSSEPAPDDAATGVDEPAAASPERKNLVAGRLQAVAPAGSDRPLGDAIAAAGDRPGQQDVVLVTDGQVPSTNRGLAARAAWLGGEFRRRHPGLRLTVVLTGPAGCGVSPVKEIVGALGAGGGKGREGGARCVPLTGAPEQDQAARLLADLR